MIEMVCMHIYSDLLVCHYRLFIGMGYSDGEGGGVIEGVWSLEVVVQWGESIWKGDM